MSSRFIAVKLGLETSGRRVMACLVGRLLHALKVWFIPTFLGNTIVEGKESELDVLKHKVYHAISLENSIFVF